MATLSLARQLDFMDAAVFEIVEATSGVGAGETTGRVFGLNNRKLYNHARKGTPKYEPNLF